MYWFKNKYDKSICTIVEAADDYKQEYHTF